MEESTSPPPAKKGGSLAFRIVLLVILAVVLGAAGYDFLYARRQPSTLIDEFDALVKGEDKAAPTEKEIQARIGFAPQETTPQGPYRMQEIYKWRSGLLFTTHDLYVRYEKADDDGTWRYETSAMGKDPDQP